MCDGMHSRLEDERAKKKVPEMQKFPPLTCDIINNNCNSGVTNVARNQAPEPLLPCCVPQLQPYLSEISQNKQEKQEKNRSKLEQNIPTCDIVNYYSSSRVTDVTGNEATETFLTRSIPQLQPDLWDGRKLKKANCH